MQNTTSTTLTALTARLNATPSVVHTSLYPITDAPMVGQTIEIEGLMLTVVAADNIGHLSQDWIDDEDMFEFEDCAAVRVEFRAATESEIRAMTEAAAAEKRAAEQAAAERAARQAEFDAFKATLGDSVMLERGRRATIGAIIFKAGNDLSGAWGTTGDVYRAGTTDGGRAVVVREYGNATMAYGSEDALREIVLSNLPALPDMPSELAAKLLADLAEARAGNVHTENRDAELVVSALGGERAVADHIKAGGALMIPGPWYYGNCGHSLKLRAARLAMLDDLEVPYVEMVRAGEANWAQYVTLAEAGFESGCYLTSGEDAYWGEYVRRPTLYRAPDGGIYSYSRSSHVASYMCWVRL